MFPQPLRGVVRQPRPEAWGEKGYILSAALQGRSNLATVLPSRYRALTGLRKLAPSPHPGLWPGLSYGRPRRAYKFWKMRSVFPCGRTNLEEAQRFPRRSLRHRCRWGGRAACGASLMDTVAFASAPQGRGMAAQAGGLGIQSSTGSQPCKGAVTWPRPRLIITAPAWL